MGIVRQKLVLQGLRSRAPVEVLVDSAASECLIRPEVARQLATPQEIPEPMKFDTSNQTDGLMVRECVMLDVCTNGQRHAAIFFVAPGLTEDAIMGATFLQAHGCRIDYKKKTLWIGKCCLRFRA